MSTSVSSREFNQHTSKAKKASKLGPVFITDRGRPEHVLLSYEEYQRLTGADRKIADLLMLPVIVEDDLELQVSREPPRAADLS